MSGRSEFNGYLKSGFVNSVVIKTLSNAGLVNCIFTLWTSIKSFKCFTFIFVESDNDLDNDPLQRLGYRINNSNLILTTLLQLQIPILGKPLLNISSNKLTHLVAMSRNVLDFMLTKGKFVL